LADPNLPPNNVITFHVKPFARELRKRCIPDGVDTQASGLARALVDPDHHQVMSD
jgi:hypothetical protein